MFEQLLWVTIGAIVPPSDGNSNYPRALTQETQTARRMFVLIERLCFVSHLVSLVPRTGGLSGIMHRWNENFKPLDSVLIIILPLAILLTFMFEAGQI